MTADNPELVQRLVERMADKLVDRAVDHALRTNLWDPIGDIEDFHKKFGLEYEGPPRLLTGEMLQFRGGFHIEEAQEWLDEGVTAEVALERGEGDGVVTGHLANQLDAVLDELYVILGTAHLQGFTRRILIEGWNRVHSRNMAKVRAERAADSKRGSTFDVVKPLGWTPPDHTDLVSDHAHRTHDQLELPYRGDEPNSETFAAGNLAQRFASDDGSSRPGVTHVGMDYGSGEYSAEAVVERTPSGDLRLVALSVTDPDIEAAPVRTEELGSFRTGDDQ